MNKQIGIDISGVTKRFGDVVALYNVSMHFNPATLYGVIGPAGAGKTTLFRLMLELMRPNKGKITYYENGRVIDFADARESVAYMPPSQSL